MRGTRLLLINGPIDDGLREWWEADVLDGQYAELGGWLAVREGTTYFVLPPGND